ncbi:restriction endonuclease subunit S [Massilia yuzhufengensis]|uniref:Type I restriction enzyme, S subunit n=1 Tax=Massilia yuzhufengensis TaxID=1164594 RepID=A0A1I1V4F5_9BURK|nr:restriction endonuclease subunit S [Massilia yuzhufengensis]SFD77917.1 type I restriction enzyme, S subunit [Massilia yuzhufengensis]
MNLSKPESWETAPLEALSILTLGGDWGQAPEFEAAEYSLALCIRGAEFRNWDNEKGGTASLRKIKNSSLASRALQIGDILVEISGGGPDQPVGRTVLIDRSALMHSPALPKICTNFLRILRSCNGIDSRFLNLYLSYFYKSGEIRNYQAGSNNLRNLKFKDYLGLDIPLPPLAEQSRIVAKIEELFSELDKGLENLKTAKAQLDAYRRALLKHAFEGRLTAQWRIDNPDKLETADVLLKRIQQSRAQRYQEQLAEWEREGNQGRKPKGPAPLRQIPTEQIELLPQLPEGWTWVQLEFLITGIDQGWSPKCSGTPAADDAWGVIKTTAVQHGRFFDAENKALPLGMKPRVQHELSVNDLLITRAGPRVRVGVCCLVRKVRKKIMNCDKVYRIRSAPSICHPEYLEGALNSPRILEAIERIKSGINDSGVNLTQGAFLNLTIPHCAFSEQEAVVMELDQQLSVIAQLDQTLSESLQQAEALRQSILKKAFSGQLIPQDPNDEPASSLLARIKAEKSAQPQGKKARK